MNLANEFQKTVEIKTLDGVKKFTYQVLSKSEADEVFHNCILSIFRALAELTDGVKVSKKQIFSAIQSLNYEDFSKLSKSLLKGMLVNSNEIGNVGDSEYWRTYPEEIYIAVFHSIKANWPGVFTRMLKVFSGSDLQQKMQKISQTIMPKKE